MENIKFKFTHPNPMNQIELIVLDFFDDLGELIIKAKKTNTKIGYDVIIPSYIDRMLGCARSTNMYKGDFNYGKSAKIANELWDLNVDIHPGISISYGNYIESISMEYTKYNDMISKLEEEKNVMDNNDNK